MGSQEGPTWKTTLAVFGATRAVRTWRLRNQKETHRAAVGRQQDMKEQEIQARWEATRPYHVGCGDSGTYCRVSVSQDVASPC